MRKVLAITVALMIAAIIITPALGYTIQSAGNQSYTVTSGARVNYSINAGTPAHNLTLDMVSAKKAVNAPAVQGTRVPYSFKTGSAMPYSVSLPGVTGVREGYQTTKAPEVVGKAAQTVAAAPAVAEAVPAVAASSAAPVAEAIPAPVEPKFTIAGTVFDDLEGNGIMNINDTGLGNWTVNLEQAGNVVKTTTTSLDGKFAFTDLVKGEYTATEVVQMGWKLISPSDGKFTVAINDSSVTNLEFANQILPAVAENVTTPAELTAKTNATI